jgi:asparagine N-glycosylation enzyme membrane subunit Stt3
LRAAAAQVYRVAAGYGFVGWLIIQFATRVLPALTLPAWSARLVIVLVLAGFPIALIRCKRPPASPFTSFGWTRSGIRSGPIRGLRNGWQNSGLRNSRESPTAVEESCLTIRAGL